MNFLVYKVAEHFGRELAKTAALVVVSTMAAEIGMRLAEKLSGAQDEAATVEDAGQTLDLSQLFPEAPEEKKQPIKVDVNVVVNSYNEENDNSKRRKDQGNVVGAPMEYAPEPCEGCEEGCQDCEA